ncbi:MAG: folylpolyglutamate synthase/dihydrofolate synthase family protein [Syntrophales bacterium]|nr:folylpolyglutamate synthase/dihydrofolate synthase family protein [Syntrophales bacterium]
MPWKMARYFRLGINEKIRQGNIPTVDDMIPPREYLSQLNSSVIRLGLAPVTRLLEYLQNPQDLYASVLIGGTNGKGSIAAMTASILREAGYRIGIYTSPHLVDLRERIRVNGEMITEEALDALIDEARGHVREDVTYFEVLTAVAFLHFCRMKVDIAVLEVGLGGRLDATNVVKPVVSVISNISLEHREYLGNRLRDIAREKAGIIKDKGVCITAAKQKPVLEIFNETCRERRAKLYRLGEHIRTRRHRNGVFDYYGISKNYKGLNCSLPGKHQIENAALALAAIEILTNSGFPVDDSAIYGGMQKTHWEGRLEILQSAPWLVVDGGHNPAGVSVLCRALKNDFSYRHLILVFGVLHDKNFPLMLKNIAPLAHRIIITKPESERAVSTSELAGIASLYNDYVEVIEPTGQALKRALYLAGRHDLICVTGSLYLVGEIKKAFSQM